MKISWNEYNALVDKLDIKRKPQLEKLFKDSITLEPYFDDVNGLQFDIYVNDEYIGYILCTINETLILIENIEIEEDYKRKHYATMVLNLIIEYYSISEVFGMAKAEAIPFWNSLGAQLPLSFCNEDPDYLVPFLIKL